MPCRAEGEFLKGMEVMEVAAAIQLSGMIGADDVASIVAFVDFLIVVGVMKSVVAGGIDYTCTAGPALTAIGEAQELVVGVVGANALDVLHSPTSLANRLSAKVHGTSQASSRQGERRSAMQ